MAASLNELTESLISYQIWLISGESTQRITGIYFYVTVFLSWHFTPLPSLLESSDSPGDRDKEGMALSARDHVN